MARVFLNENVSKRASAVRIKPALTVPERRETPPSVEGLGHEGIP